MSFLFNFFNARMPPLYIARPHIRTCNSKHDIIHQEFNIPKMYEAKGVQKHSVAYKTLSVLSEFLR